MKLSCASCLSESSRRRRTGEAALTLMEVLVATSILMLVMVTTMNYFCVIGRGLSSSTSQCELNWQGGYALQMIQNRVRLATLVSNDSTGNILTIGLDDNPLVDSNGDGIPWNDQDHYEQFIVTNTASTNVTTNFTIISGSTGTNMLIYIPDTRYSSNRTVLISSGVRNLPGWNIFTVTNAATVLIRYGITDTYTNDYYESYEIKGCAVALNRKVATNTISILPY